MFGDALSFPVRGNDWLPTTVIGGVLGVLGFLVVPGIILQGYSIRVLRSAAAGNDHLPSFTEWGGLLVDGVKGLAIALVYALVVVVPAGVVAVLLGVAGSSGRGAGVLAGALGLAGIVVILGLALVVSFVLPAALANFAIEGTFSAAFDVRRVVEGAFTGRYVLAWGAALVVGFVGGLIGGALTVFLVGFFLLFHVQVVTYYLFGRGFAEGTGRFGGVSSPPGANYVESDAPKGDVPEFGSLGGLEPIGEGGSEESEDGDGDTADVGEDTDETGDTASDSTADDSTDDADDDDDSTDDAEDDDDTDGNRP